MEYRLEDIIDIPLFQSLLDSLNKIYPFPSAILNNEGEVLISTELFDICSKFHRVNKHFESECIKSNRQILTRLSEANPAITYQCPYGMIDNAIPIIIKGKQIASFYTGPLFTEEPDLNHFKDQAIKYGFDENDYLEAIKKVPIWQKAKLDEYLVFIKKLTEMLTKIGYKNYQDLDHKKLIEQKDKEIKQSKKQIQKAFETLAIGMGILSIEGKFVQVNQSLLRILGYNQEELYSKTIHEITYPEDLQSDQDLFLKILNGEISSFETEKRYLDKNQCCVWTKNIVQLVKENHNSLPYFILQIEDITDHKTAIDKLKFEQYLMNALMDNVAGSIYFKDLNSKFIRANKAQAQLFGFNDPEQLIGKTDFDFFTKIHAQQAFDDEQEIIRSGIPIRKEERETWPDRPDSWVSTYKLPLFDKNSKIIGTCGISMDITDRKLAEQKLKEQNEEYETLNEELKQTNIELEEAKERAEENEEKYKNAIIDLNNAQSVAKLGRWKWYLNTGKLEWSIEMFRIFGIAEEEFSGNMNEIVERFVYYEDLEIVKTSNHSVLKKGIPVSLEYRIVLPDKSIKVVWQEPGKLEKDEYSNQIVLSGIVQDITERKRFEHELLLAKEKAEESDRLKSAFLQNMSHEIRTPMNAILGFSNMLDRTGMTSEKRNTYISIIKSSSNQLLSVVSDILTISSLDTKQEKLRHESVSINNLLQNLYTIFKTQASNKYISISLKSQLPDDSSEIFVDGIKLKQVLNNLISNALKFTEKGSIEFGYVLIRADHEAFLQFFVKDTGIGIKPELHEKIFERFRQADLSINRRYGGTGLGLSISKGFIELMGGKIWLESEPGMGSTFYFTIPYKPALETIISEKQFSTSKTLNTILIAEDEEYNFLLIREMLSDLDFQFIHAKNGFEAIEICKSNPDIGLILMDIKMPVIDGHIAAMRIKEFRPKLIIIAQTAYTLKVEKEKYKKAFDGYITKPIDENELKQILFKFFYEK